MRTELRKRLAPLIRLGLSRTEILTLLAIAAQPFVLIVLALVIGALEYPWLLLVWLIQLLAIAAIAIVLLRRRLAVRRSRLNNPQVAGFLSPSLLERPAESAALSGDPDAERLSINRLIARASEDELVAFALHAGTRPPVDAVALRATSGALDLDALLALGALAAPERWRALGAVNANALVALARIASIHDLGFDAPRRLLDVALDRSAEADELAWLRLAELLIAAGRREEAAGVLDRLKVDTWQRRLLLADLLNPGDVRDPDRDAAWLALVNPSYRAAGLEPVVLEAGAGVAFDRLAAPAAVPSSATGPRVSVIMSAHRPDEDTLHAVRAIVHQTWRDWELLILDDASGSDYDEIYAQIAALDDRIVVVRSEVNAGTYVRRNEGLGRATGEFVTMQDSDDWSHPRRLELQVQHLLSHPDVPANLTSALRVSSDLMFTQGRGLYLRLSEPSLMFRRQQVVERIGYFDSTRKSADSEYRVRIGAVFGTEVPHLLSRGPLMLMRFDDASLSGSDFADGWTHPARVIYRSAYFSWHDAARRSGLHMPFPLESRPFAAPAHMLGDDLDRGEVDVLLVLDARRGGTLDAHAATIGASIRKLVAAGRRVGLMHAPGFMRGTQEKRLSDTYHRLVDDGVVVEVISRDEQVHAGTVVVWGSGALLGVPEATQVTAAAVALVSGSTGSDRIVTRAYARQLAQARFGQPVSDIEPSAVGTLGR